MRSSLRSLICIIVLLNSTIYCTPVTHNDGYPRIICQDFPLLNYHMCTNKITKIANAEGNKPWWQKIRRTPVYAACLEMEHVLHDLQEARTNLASPQPQAKEPDLRQFTKENLGQFVREKIAIILGSDYQEGMKEYAAFMTVIIEGKKRSEESPTDTALTPKRKRTISISDGSRPQWNYVPQ